MTAFPRDQAAAQARHRQSLFVWISVVLIVLIPVDAYIIGRFDLRLVAVQLCWSAAFLVGSILTRRLGSPVTDRVDFLLSGMSAILMVAIVGLTGGSRSLLLPFCLVLPVSVSLLSGRLRDSILSSLICGLASLAIIRAGDPDRPTLVAWAVLVFTTTFIAVSSAVLQMRVRKTVSALGKSRSRLAHRRAVNAQKEIEAKRFRLVGQLAGGVAHEVNNPLAVVKANLRFARDEVEKRAAEAWRATVLDSLAEAAGGVERIRGLVRDLAELSPQSVKDAEDCRPEDLVEDALDLISASPPLVIAHETVPGLPRVRVVRCDLVQVLRSLLHNAIEAAETPATTGVHRVVIRASEDSLGVRFDVDDSGPGFTKDVFPNLFEPFFTTKPVGRGTGLSLAKAREKVNRCGGQIAAENRPAGGARVTVRLPAASQSSTGDAPPTP